MYVCMYVCMYIYLCMYVYIWVYVYIYAYIRMYIYVYMYILGLCACIWQKQFFFIVDINFFHFYSSNYLVKFKPEKHHLEVVHY